MSSGNCGCGGDRSITRQIGRTASGIGAARFFTRRGQISWGLRKRGGLTHILDVLLELSCYVESESLRVPLCPVESGGLALRHVVYTAMHLGEIHPDE